MKNHQSDYLEIVKTAALAIVPALFLISSLAIPVTAAEELIVYSGRTERLIKPVLDRFEQQTGITVRLLASKTTDLVNRLRAEGSHTPADVFITNDAGALTRASELNLLQSYKEPALFAGRAPSPPGAPSFNAMPILDSIPPAFRAKDLSWLGLSGRFYIVVYNTAHVNPKEISSILDLADPRWQGNIAIHNAGSEYLQSAVAIILAVHGTDKTRAFLKGLKRNAENNVYGKSSQIVNAVAKGEVWLGLVNHYYIYRHLAKDPTAPIAALIPDQKAGHMGAILNVAGIGIVQHTKHLEAATQLVAYLASPEGQKLFADLNKEYPLNPNVSAHPVLPDRKRFRAATVPLWKLGELREPTMTLIEEVGLR